MASSQTTSSITQVPGIKVGHAQNTAARTGCTVILCGPDGAVAGVDVRGAAPGTRETDLLEPGNLVDRVHAIVLTGGSVFGLDSACGVVQFLEERGIGYETGVARVPIVPAAVIYDLAVGDATIRPNSRMGYEACLQASETAAEGRIGAGTGATVGKILGLDYASPGGIGTASVHVRGGATVAALVVVNAFGDIVDPRSGRILAGARDPGGRGWLDTSRELSLADISSKDTAPFSGIQNTTLAVIATDATLDKAQAKRVASMAHDGLARAVRPVHTMFDGDTVFAVSTGNLKADVTAIGAAAADILAHAIVRAALASSTR
jgi:L-aminopeptidase/D-esterase-like protein